MVSMLYGNAGKPGAARAQISQLWSNPNPASSFGAQTVTLADPLSNYDLIRVAVILSTSTQTLDEHEFLIENLLTDGYTAAIRICGATTNRTGARTFTVPSASTVTFASAAYNGETNNAYAIPVAIYGVKL